MDHDPWDYLGRTGAGPKQPPRDTKIVEAKEALVEFFEDKKGETFYLKQIEVFFEKTFFHWITDAALHELIEEDYLNTELVELVGPTRIRFVTHRSNRFVRRAVKRKAKVVRASSEPKLAQACGTQAEILFKTAFAERGFTIGGINVREFAGRTWTETGHNLDFVMTRDGATYGCEVKNTWDYIDRKELEAKLRMCRFFEVRPLFIMRFAPKTYLWEYIHAAKGFWILFETHIFPLAQDELVDRIRAELGLNVDAPRRIPDGIIDRFMNNVHYRRVLGVAPPKAASP